MLDSQLLTLEEAAKLLGVDYRTAYRLVREGEIPAGKVGRVYRIAREDLQTYFEAQKRRQVEAVRPTRGQDAQTGGGFRCGACGRSFLTALSSGGGCEVCAGRICIDCWSALGQRRCAAHGTGGPSGQASTPP